MVSADLACMKEQKTRDGEWPHVRDAGGTRGGRGGDAGGTPPNLKFGERMKITTSKTASITAWYETALLYKGFGHETAL